MATSVVFNGKKRKIPGVYTEIKSAIDNPIRTASYGRILLIDTGSGAGFGGGAGIEGTLEKGANAVYRIDNIRDFQSFLKGGLLWLLGKPLFYPNGIQSIGVTSVDYVRACATVPAEMNMEFGDELTDDDSSADGGTLVVQVRNEGVIGNGALEGLNLYKGYGWKMVAGENDATKYIFKFYVGTYKGEDGDGDPYDGVSKASSVPLLLVSSPEVRTLSELSSWMDSDTTFNYYFKKKSVAVTGSGVIDDTDLLEYSDFSLASGGTETYNSTHLQTVLDHVTPLDYTFVLSDRYGDDAMDAENGLIWSHIINDAKFEKFMVVGGGLDSLKFNQSNGSIPIAQYYNSDRVIVVHGGVKKKSNITGTGFKEYPSIYKAAAVLGRICGLEPQIPVTNKGIDIDGELHPLKEKEIELCLDNGVLCTGWDAEAGQFIVIQGINSLQDNVNLVNEDATSFSIQIKRIFAQLNKELYINAKKKILLNERGTNRFTASPQVLKDFSRSYLKSRVVSSTEDNLLISFQNVQARREQDNMYVSYEAVPNGEITKLFFTGIIID